MPTSPLSPLITSLGHKIKNLPIETSDPTLTRFTTKSRTYTMHAENDKRMLVQAVKELKPHIHPPVPNPAPLGLIGFGLTTCLLQMKHTRLTGDSEPERTGVDNVVMGFAMFFGGLLQVRMVERVDNSLVLG